VEALGNCPVCPPLNPALHTINTAASAVGELFEPVGRLEVVRDDLVEARDHLVDGLLPRLLAVLLGRDGHVELTQCRLHHVPKPLRHLPTTRTANPAIKVKSKVNGV